MQVQEINSLTSAVKDYGPRILNFSEHYKLKHGIEPPSNPNEGNKFLDKDEKVTEKISQQKIKRRILPIMIVSFLTSGVLSVAAHSTNILDRFKDSIKTSLKAGLDFISVALGAVTTVGILDSIAKDNKKEENKLNFHEHDSLFM